MTREEFQRDLIRMFDSIRSDCKGESGCSGVDCNDCPMHKIVCGRGQIRPFETIEIVENWVKEHHIVTNAEKFKEVFGTEPPINACVNNIDCENCEYYGDVDCNVRDLFWDAEYKE